jgi:hypothetical protein
MSIIVLANGAGFVDVDVDVEPAFHARRLRGHGGNESLLSSLVADRPCAIRTYPYPTDGTMPADANVDRVAGLDVGLDAILHTGWPGTVW